MNISKLIELKCNCLINCYLQYMIDNLAIFNIPIFTKGVRFLFQACLKRRNSSACLKIVNIILCNILMLKKYYFVAFFLKLFYSDFTTFWKMCRGVPSYMDYFLSLGACHHEMSTTIFHLPSSFANSISSSVGAQCGGRCLRAPTWYLLRTLWSCAGLKWAYSARNVSQSACMNTNHNPSKGIC